MNNDSFSALLTSFSQVKILNYDRINVPDADMTVVVDLKKGTSSWRFNVASIKTGRAFGRAHGWIWGYSASVSDSSMEKFGKLIGRRANCVQTFAEWAEASEHYPTTFSIHKDHFEPGPGSWTVEAKKSLKLDIHNMIADYLAYVDEALHADYRDQVATAAKKLAEEKAADWDHYHATAAKKLAEEKAQEPAQDVAEVEPTETTVEPMTAREHKMRGDLECVLAYVQGKLTEFDDAGCQIDDENQPIDREEVKLGEFMVQSIEAILSGSISDEGAGGLVISADDQEHLDTLCGDIEIDFSKFLAQVSGFRRHHYNDGAWNVPDGSSIDAECERIESMKHLGQVKAYLDHDMGEGEFWAQVAEYVSGDHRPSPEDMADDDVLKYVLEFGAMHTGDGRGFDLLDTQEADDILVEMNEDSAYLQRYTDRARVIMLARTLEVAVPAAR